MFSVQKATDNDKLAPGENKLWGRGVVAYTTNSTAHPDCRLFGLGELAFIDELRKEQVRPWLFSFLSIFYGSRKYIIFKSTNANIIFGSCLSLFPCS